jgi:hypothetical protein
MSSAKRPRSRKRPPLEHLEHKGDPLEHWKRPPDPIDKLNGLVRATGKAIVRERSGAVSNARHEQQAAKVRADAKFYTVLVFDTGNQCQAFIDYIQVKAHLTHWGDLFLDGRAIADALGCKLPDPEYELKPQRRGVSAPTTKRLARVRRR